MAAQHGHVKILELLLSREVDASCLTGDLTALQLAIRFRQSGTVECLINASVDVNALTRAGASALATTAHSGFNQILELCLRKEGDPNLADRSSITSLMIASYRENMDFVKKLVLDGKTDVNTQSFRGLTALICASTQGCSPIVKFLLEHRANANLLAGGNLNALTAAAQKRHGEVIEILLPITHVSSFETFPGRTALTGRSMTLTVS